VAVSYKRGTPVAPIEASGCGRRRAGDRAHGGRSGDVRLEFFRGASRPRLGEEGDARSEDASGDLVLKTHIVAPRTPNSYFVLRDELD